MVDGFNELADLLTGTTGEMQNTSKATVTRIDDEGTVWVHFPGGVDETPVHTCLASVSPGDTVPVEIAQGRATIPGNKSDVPAASSTVRKVARVADHADEIAEQAVKGAANAQAVADEAAEVATATNQHFWTDTSGSHVTETEDDATTGHNILINSLGILLRNAVSNLVSITRSAIAFFDSNGDMTASFGTNGAQIGRSGEPNVWIDSTGAYITGDSDGYVRTVVDASGMYLFDDNSGAYPYPVARLMPHVASVAEDADSATPGMFAMFGNTFQMAGGSLDGSGISWWNQISSSHGPIWLLPQDNTNVIIGTDDPTMGRHLTRDGEITGATSVGHGSGLDVHGSVNVDGGVYIGTGTDNYAVTKAAMDTALADKSDKFSILSYGHSTWNDFLTAYNSNTVVYCRASSNSNPATGAQTRLAFMAYVNADPPTNVEFQYYRSVSSHTASQQGDQVYVYKLTNAGTWSVTVREASVKVAAGDGLDMTYASGTATLSLGSEVGSRVAHDQSTSVTATSGTWTEICNVSLDAGTWVVHGNAVFGANGTGRRTVCLSTATGSPGSGDLRQRGMRVVPIAGVNTYVNTCITVKLSSTTTMRLFGEQTSGGDLGLTGCITAVRIV